MSLRRLFDSFRTRRAQPREGAAAHGGPEWIVIGLGNPGDEYRNSRHNLGFAIVDRIARSHGARINRRKFAGLCGEFELGGLLVVAAKPQSYYNGSGECAAALLNFYKAPASRLIVVHDELDLDAGRLRIKTGGGDAGNRGVRSIAESLGAADFIRVRVGIAHPEEGRGTIDHILQPMSADERAAFELHIERAAAAVETIITDGLERAMNLYNQRD